MVSGTAMETLHDDMGSMVTSAGNSVDGCRLRELTNKVALELDEVVEL